MAWTPKSNDAVIRVIRTIEYVGTESWIYNTLAESLPLGHSFKPSDGLRITVLNETRTDVQSGLPCTDGWKHGA